MAQRQTPFVERLEVRKGLAGGGRRLGRQFAPLRHPRQLLCGQPRLDGGPGQEEQH